MMPNQSEIRFRWAEILLTVLVSAGTTAIAVTWTVSATLTSMQMDIDALKGKQASHDATIANLSSQASLQNTQIAVNDANYKNIILSLGEIKDELKRRR